MKSKIEEVDNRAYGMDLKTKNYRVQFFSSLVFGFLGLILLNKQNYLYFSLLFILESLGQFFLAIESKVSLKNNDFQIRYFNKSWFGFCALLIFMGVLIVRYQLVIVELPNYNLIINILTFAQVTSTIMFFIFFDARKDMFVGLTIFLSALILGLVLCFLSSNFAIGVNQLVYALLLLVGTLYLKPWVAETINILLWIQLFFLIS